MVTARTKLLDLFATVKKNGHSSLLDHETILLHKADVVQLKAPSKLSWFSCPNATSKIDAVFREKRMIAMRAEL
jgi:hypothetical protein